MVDIDKYISRFPKETAVKLAQLRTAVKKAAPNAEEIISYKMPAFKLGGMLVWYGGHTKHIGFYPRVSAMTTFSKELAAYKTSKGAVQFPLDKPLPIGLITKMVKYRVQENLQKGKIKG